VLCKAKASNRHQSARVRRRRGQGNLCAERDATRISCYPTRGASLCRLIRGVWSIRWRSRSEPRRSIRRIRAESSPLKSNGRDPRPGLSWILLAVLFAALIGLQVTTASASTSSSVFVGATRKVTFRLEVDNTSQARLVIRFRSRSLRGRVRKEGLVAYCSWRRDGTSANPIKLGRQTAFAHVLLSHSGSLQPSACGIRSVLERIKTRDGRSEYLRLVVVRMRPL
jgi:hypothetical protein